MVSDARFHALVPAAGVGARLGAPVPKQYLELDGRPMLWWTVQALLAAPFVAGVDVVVAPDDARAGDILRDAPRTRVRPVGGASRRDSVLAGLLASSADWREDDWVLVHDAARPGLGLAALERLREALADDPVGGLLALPAADTVKWAHEDGPRVQATWPRERVWLAQTPQMFRLGVLRAALQAHPSVTDEAAAIEAAGLPVRLVAGERRNFKVTTPEDLELMRAIWPRTAGS